MTDAECAPGCDYPVSWYHGRACQQKQKKEKKKMTRKIRVTTTNVYEYIPDFNTDLYATEGITTLEDALEIDKRDLKEGDISIDELADLPISVTDVWEIVDVDDEG